VQVRPSEAEDRCNDLFVLCRRSRDGDGLSLAAESAATVTAAQLAGSDHERLSAGFVMHETAALYGANNQIAGWTGHSPGVLWQRHQAAPPTTHDAL
jgi:hypothetical protein